MTNLPRQDVVGVKTEVGWAGALHSLGVVLARDVKGIAPVPRQATVGVAELAAERHELESLSATTVRRGAVLRK